MADKHGERIIITDVPAERIEHYRAWAQSLEGKMISVAQEPDGEFTIVILLP